MRAGTGYWRVVRAEGRAEANGIAQEGNGGALRLRGVGSHLPQADLAKFRAELQEVCVYETLWLDVNLCHRCS